MAIVQATGFVDPLLVPHPPNSLSASNSGSRSLPICWSGTRQGSPASAAAQLAQAGKRALGSGEAQEEELIVPRFAHEWQPIGITAWRCVQCGATAGGSPTQPTGGACTGLPKAMAARIGKGHVLHKFDPTPGTRFAPYVCCELCGASGSQLAWQHLSGSCAGKFTSATTKMAWQRLQNGKHPHPRHKGDHLFFPGVPLPQRQAPGE